MKNKSTLVISVVSLVVGLIAIVTAFSAHNNAGAPVQSANLGGVYDTQNVAPNLVKGVDYGTLPTNVNYQGGKIQAKSNVAWYRNVSSDTQYVENVEVSTDGTASSSFKIFAFATSTDLRTSNLYDFTAPANNPTTGMLINGFQIATSSTATTTSSDDTKGSTAGPFAGSVVQLPKNSFVYIWMESGQALNAGSGICFSPATTGQCESATSTNRGFNLQWRLLEHN